MVDFGCEVCSSVIAGGIYWRRRDNRVGAFLGDRARHCCSGSHDFCIAVPRGDATVDGRRSHVAAAQRIFAQGLRYPKPSLLLNDWYLCFGDI